MRIYEQVTQWLTFCTRNMRIKSAHKHCTGRIDSAIKSVNSRGIRFDIHVKALY
ncbi:hypothetical protein PAUR_a3482 [Pseudoalteromonas aurantia 208]|uniref:Uncharacterized protein n=1 Tax=Pseudoalteromonas aurantia 208 TaxID=1314867 RepID=A0ABR9E649_9GAMM|nr:hypothetical protein [Pseudoalteromonas aurantia 208]